MLRVLGEAGRHVSLDTLDLDWGVALQFLLGAGQQPRQRAQLTRSPEAASVIELCSQLQHAHVSNADLRCLSRIMVQGSKDHDVKHIYCILLMCEFGEQTQYLTCMQSPKSASRNTLSTRR